MSNEFLWVVLMVVNFVGILIFYRYAGKTGLYVWTAIATITANIQVVKTVQLFGFVATLGNIVYGTTFLVTDILSENYGKKEARKAVYIGFGSLISMTVIMQIAILFKPDASDFAQPALKTIFSIMPRIAIASLTAYWLSQLHDIWAYHLWKNKFPQTKFLWMRNNFSTMVSQFIDSLVFCFIAFWKVYPQNIFWSIFWTTYIFKWIVAAADTPFLYFAKKLHDSGKINELVVE
ncbi:queuosine precursor transporter [Thermosipho ferrireducens]|uniref:Probable queuosine precursor transporter n=1 Tax=Thermosipho ferrireducens TaxID=2571116 RepID=A0ABX7S6C4_9BACT|nr:queuosine precursor transporter [Thermosipho ferrireducens]QTA38122.1 queuosine precursor transporter [Thermosipho ferrireducens]